jgi:hypothetical protein
MASMLGDAEDECCMMSTSYAVLVEEKFRTSLA